MKNSAGKHYSTQCIETKYCSTGGLCVLTICWLIYVLALSFSTLAVHKLYEEESYSFWNCPAGQETWQAGLCSGVDLRILSNDEVGVYRTADSPANFLFTAIDIVPYHLKSDVAHIFPVNFTYNITDVKSGKVRKYNEEMTISCDSRGVECERIPLFVGTPSQYEISIQLSTEYDDIQTAAEESLGDFHLIDKHSAPSYSYFQIIFRSVSLVFTIIALGYYLFKFFGTPLSSTVEQKAVIWYALFDILFDNPIFFLGVITSSTALSVIDKVFQSAFTAFSMVFILFILGGFITRKTTCSGFVLPRVLFACLFFILDLVENVIRTVSPDIDRLTKVSYVNSGLAIFNIVLIVIWALWFIYSVIRCYVVSRQHPRAIKGRYRYFVFFVILSSVLYIAALFLQTVYGAELAGRLQLIAHVIAGAFGVVLLIWLSPSSSPRTTSTTLQGALHPKTSTEMRPVTEDGSAVAPLSHLEEDSPAEETSKLDNESAAQPPEDDDSKLHSTADISDTTDTSSTAI